MNGFREKCVGKERLVGTFVAIPHPVAVEVTAQATAETTQDASALADVVRLLAQVALMRNNDPEAAAVLKTLNVAATDRTVNLSVSIPEAQMELIFRPNRRPARVRPAAHRP